MTEKLSLVLTEEQAMFVADSINFTAATLNSDIENAVSVLEGLVEMRKHGYFKKEVIIGLLQLVSKMCDWGMSRGRSGDSPMA